MKTKILTPKLILKVLCVLALLLASCSGDDDVIPPEPDPSEDLLTTKEWQMFELVMDHWGMRSLNYSVRMEMARLSSYALHKIANCHTCVEDEAVREDLADLFGTYTTGGPEITFTEILNNEQELGFTARVDFGPGSLQNLSVPDGSTLKLLRAGDLYITVRIPASARDYLINMQCDNGGGDCDDTEIYDYVGYTQHIYTDFFGYAVDGGFYDLNNTNEVLVNATGTTDIIFDVDASASKNDTTYTYKGKVTLLKRANIEPIVVVKEWDATSSGIFEDDKEYVVKTAAGEFPMPPDQLVFPVWESLLLETTAIGDSGKKSTVEILSDPNGNANQYELRIAIEEEGVKQYSASFARAPTTVKFKAGAELAKKVN